MHHHLLLLLLFGGLIVEGLYVVVFFINARLTRHSQGDWLVSTKGRQMRFREKTAYRKATLLGWCSVPMMLLPCVFAYPSFMLVFCVSWVLLLTYACLSGPQDVTIDGERRVYEVTNGSHWRRRTQIRPLDEIAGVCTTPSNYGNYVVMPLKSPTFTRSRPITLDKKFARVEAVAMAENVSRTTGLPVIPCPKR